MPLCQSLNQLVAMQQLGMSQCVSLSHTHTPEYVLVENKTKQNKKNTEINLKLYRQFNLNALPVFTTTTKTQVEYCY